MIEKLEIQLALLFARLGNYFLGLAIAIRYKNRERSEHTRCDKEEVK